MSKVAVTKSKLDELALQVSGKSGESMPLTIDEMTEAVEGIDVVNNQSKSVTPMELAQTVEPDTGYTGLGSVSIGAIDSSYVGTAVPRRYSSDLTVNGRTVTAPAGYYASSVSKSVSQMTLPTAPVTSASGTQKATISISETTRYLNIPTGYNTSAAYYTIRGVSSYYVGSGVPRYTGEVGVPTVMFDGTTPATADWQVDSSWARATIELADPFEFPSPIMQASYILDGTWLSCQPGYAEGYADGIQIIPYSNEQDMVGSIEITTNGTVYDEVPIKLLVYQEATE